MIYCVEDERNIRELIVYTLESSGLRAKGLESGAELFEELSSHQASLILLDIMLPKIDGFGVCAQIRRQSQVPILFLSARDEDNDRLFGLGLGADDYITKPFLPQELLLRIHAILKRVYFSSVQLPKEEKVLILGKREISFENAQVTAEGISVSLTAKELLLLKKLNQNRGKIVTFDAICQAVWEDSYYGYENTLMVHIRHLREKIEEDPSHPVWIQTARGLGYRLKKEEGQR